MKNRLFILISLSFIILSAASVDQNTLSLQAEHYIVICGIRNEAANIDIIKNYFELGFDVNHVRLNGDTLLHLAASISDKEFCRFLIDEKKLNIDAKNFNGDTALHTAIDDIKYENGAIKQCSIQTLEFLISRKANIFEKNNQQRTTLLLAEIWNKIYKTSCKYKPVCELLQSRADEIDQSKREANKAELELIEFMPKEVTAIVGDYVRE